jgi:hypothetical protein
MFSQNHNFGIQLFVLGGVGLVLASLTGAFWAYFMYLWKTWDNGKRDPTVTAFVVPEEELVTILLNVTSL